MPVTVVRRRLGLDADVEPLEVLRILRDEPGLFGLVGAWHGSATVIGCAPVRRLPDDADPFQALADQRRVPRRLLFGGGWVGVLGYQLGARLERLPTPPPRPQPMPDFTLAFYDHVLVRDAQGWWFEALDEEPGRVEAAWHHLTTTLAAGATAPSARSAPYACSDFVGDPDGAGHQAAIRSTLEHLAAGDIYQANVCRRFEASFTGDPLDVFCAGVTELAPSYAAFLRTPKGAVVSFSPELFLRRDGRQVSTSPIKGTAPLDTAVELLADSAKDRAENVMIVDLMRNDLGRVCTPGSISVTHLSRPEQHTGVWHLVSEVVGRLADDADDAALLRATFPPGSVTGAPKVRAMEVISEVETTGREAYTGAIGYVSPVAGLELSVAIRTFEFAEGRVWLGAGGGVVADSTPAGELRETVVKAAPLITAIGARLHDAEVAILPVCGTEPLPRTTSKESRVGAEPGDARALADRLTSYLDREAGLFTTCLVVDGHPVELDAHLARLSASVRACYGVDLPTTVKRSAAASAAGRFGRHRLRIDVTPVRDGEVTSGIAISSLPPPHDRPLQIIPVVLPGGLGGHKFADRRRLHVVEPSSGAWTRDCDALITDADGSLLETGRGNIFLVSGGAVLTPALDGRLLPGVTRQRVVDILESAGLPVVTRRDLTRVDLRNADEVFVTGSVDGVRGVDEVSGDGTWPIGPTTRWLQGQLRIDESARPAGHRHRPVALRSTPRPLQVLVVDNYDSFVFNLDQYLRELGARTHVVRSDDLDIDAMTADVSQGTLHGVVVSPGPGGPADAGGSIEVIARLGPLVPILGVCLGMQCMAAAYGGRVVRADRIVHGKPELVHHDESGVFAGLSGPLVAARYHSLVVSEPHLPASLTVTARTARGEVMGLRHRQFDVEGVQFHPESILSRHGHHVLTNFLHTCAAATLRAPVAGSRAPSMARSAH